MALIKYIIETILVLLAIEIVLGQHITPPQAINRSQNELFRYLQPPPPVPVLNYNFQNYNSRVWKQPQQPRQQQQKQGATKDYTNPKSDLSFMQKVVRFFGFGGNNSPPKTNFKDVPQNYQQYQQQKFHPSQNVQYRGNNYHAPEIQSILPAAAPSEWPAKNTIVQPKFYSHQSFIHGLAPIPVPNLSATPIPPFYDAKSFLYNPYGANFVKPFTKSESKSHHQKYKIEAVSDIIVGSTKSPAMVPPIHTVPNIIATQPPKFSKISENFPSHLYKDLEITSDTDIEVIKSIPVAHFSTTVLQYPNLNNQILHQQQSYGTNLGSIKHDIQVLNTLINESLINEPISVEDSNPSASHNQNFTVGSEIQFVRPETTTRDYLYDEEFSETKQPTIVENPIGVPDQIIYGKPNGIENTVSVPTTFPEPQENYQNINRFSKSSFFNSIPPSETQKPTTWTTGSPIQTTLYDETKKKSKQIQIIIPYTVNREKSGKYVTVNYDNWSVRNSDQNDDFVHGESNILYQTNRPEFEKKNPKYLTKILASNLRELLKKEIPKFNKSSAAPDELVIKRPFFIDQTKLQMNIDDWTEQEFSTSNMEQKASTISFLVPSKIIPSEYLTTTPSTVQTTTVWPESEETSYEDDYYKDQSGYEDDEKSHSTEETRSFANNLWHKLGVTISPITHEKVHVVTPLKLNAVASNDQKKLADKLIASNFKNENQFKSPRFIVRPTPGSATKSINHLKSTLAYSINNLETTTESVKNSGQVTLLKPKLFGYMNYFSPLAELIEKENDELSEKQRIQIVTPLSFIRRNNLDSGDENVSN